MFESSAESRKFGKARAELLESPGPKEKAVHALGFTTSKKKGCSLDGREAYNLLKCRNLADVIFGVNVYGKLKVGDPTVQNLAKQYFKLRYKELNLTC